jgi:hypothetical protein
MNVNVATVVVSCAVEAAAAAVTATDSIVAA